MATSSIFHSIKIDTEEKAEAFVDALEASEKEPWVRKSKERHSVVTDPDTIRNIMEKNKMVRS